MKFDYHCKECGDHGRTTAHDWGFECNACRSMDIKGEDGCAESGCEECKELEAAVEIPDGI